MSTPASPRPAVEVAVRGRPTTCPHLLPARTLAGLAVAVLLPVVTVAVLAAPAFAAGAALGLLAAAAVRVAADGPVTPLMGAAAHAGRSCCAPKH